LELLVTLGSNRDDESRKALGVFRDNTVSVIPVPWALTARRWAFVLGYHGCDHLLAEEPFEPSDNDHNWICPRPKNSLPEGWCEIGEEVELESAFPAPIIFFLPADL